MKWVQAVLNYMYIYICMYLQNTPGANFIELRKHNISTKTKLVNKTRPPAKPSCDGLFLPVSAAGNVSIICGDTGGVVHALLPYSHLWKLRLDSSMQEVRCSLCARICLSYM